MNIQKHGGQDNHVHIEFKQDFSVTTNYMGASKKAIASLDMTEIEHYPAQTFEPYISNLRNFLFRGQKENPNMMLGNGASELIDLIVRSIPGNKWKPSRSAVQFLEYERSCKMAQKEKCMWNNTSTNVSCLINPNNPTGDYLSVEEMKEYIMKNCTQEEASHVLVDESMQPWYGEDWRTDSLLSQTDWIADLAKTGTYVYIIHSWTKFFTCTGLRYGSLICPTAEIRERLLQMQVPWTVNVLALQYIDSCITDEEYMNSTWNNTRQYRAYQVQKINEHFPTWKCIGSPFLSWIWVDVNDTKIANLAYKLAKYNGTPIRLGTMGYQMETYVRFAVREPAYFDDLLLALQDLKQFHTPVITCPHVKINQNIIHSFEWIDCQDLLAHEEYIEERHSKLLEYLQSIEKCCSIPALIVCQKTKLIIDGHHRFSVMKKMGIQKIPCLLLNYKHQDIIVNPYESVSKQAVVDSATTGQYLKPKSTCHMVVDLKGSMHPIQVLSPIIFLNITGQ